MADHSRGICCCTARQRATAAAHRRYGCGVTLPKLVVFDVDGTLLDWNGTILPSTRAVLTRLRERDIPVVLATGRPHAIADQTVDHVGGADWIVCGNGAVLLEVATGVRYRDSCLPADVALPLTHEIRRLVPGVGFAVEVGDVVLEEPGFARRVPEPSLQPPIADVVAALPADLSTVRRLISFHDDFDARLEDLAAIVGGLLDDRCQVQFGGLAFVDVSPRGDHKAVALQVLIEHLGLSATEVVAFGDGRNDVEMLRWAGTGVAMGNAHAEAKAAADVVTATVDDEGVARFLDPLLDDPSTE